MQRRSSILVEGIVDVGIVVIDHIDNLAKLEALNFLKRVLLWEIKQTIPLSIFLGAYHLITRYLKVPKLEAKRGLIRTLEVESPSFYEDIRVGIVMDALEYSVAYNIESWDGYLVSLVRDFNANIIYSIDNDFKKVPEITLVNPISEEKMREYHEWISNLK